MDARTKANVIKVGTNYRIDLMHNNGILPAGIQEIKYCDFSNYSKSPKMTRLFETRDSAEIATNKINELLKQYLLREFSSLWIDVRKARMSDRYDIYVSKLIAGDGTQYSNWVNLEIGFELYDLNITKVIQKSFNLYDFDFKTNNNLGVDL